MSSNKIGVGIPPKPKGLGLLPKTLMKKKRNIFAIITSTFRKFNFADKDVPRPKKETDDVPPPDYTLEELLADIPETKFSDKNMPVEDKDIPPANKETKPVPPPDYTLEELLANIPKHNLKTSQANSSEEVDTGQPVGKEVW